MSARDRSKAWLIARASSPLTLARNPQLAPLVRAECWDVQIAILTALLQTPCHATWKFVVSYEWSSAVLAAIWPRIVAERHIGAVRYFAHSLLGLSREMLCQIIDADWREGFFVAIGSRGAYSRARVLFNYRMPSAWRVTLLNMYTEIEVSGPHIDIETLEIHRRALRWPAEAPLLVIGELCAQYLKDKLDQNPLLTLGWMIANFPLGYDIMALLTTKRAEFLQIGADETYIILTCWEADADFWPLVLELSAQLSRDHYAILAKCVVKHRKLVELRGLSDFQPLLTNIQARPDSCREMIRLAQSGYDLFNTQANHEWSFEDIRDYLHIVHAPQHTHYPLVSNDERKVQLLRHHKYRAELICSPSHFASDDRRALRALFEWYAPRPEAGMVVVDYMAFLDSEVRADTCAETLLAYYVLIHDGVFRIREDQPPPYTRQAELREALGALVQLSQDLAGFIIQLAYDLPDARRSWAHGEAILRGARHVYDIG